MILYLKFAQTVSNFDSAKDSFFLNYTIYIRGSQSMFCEHSSNVPGKLFQTANNFVFTQKKHISVGSRWKRVTKKVAPVFLR